MVSIISKEDSCYKTFVPDQATYTEMYHSFLPQNPCINEPFFLTLVPWQLRLLEWYTSGIEWDIMAWMRWLREIMESSVECGMEFLSDSSKTENFKMGKAGCWFLWRRDYIRIKVKAEKLARFFDKVSRKQLICMTPSQHSTVTKIFSSAIALSTKINP